MKNHLRAENGFTLLELLISMAIIAVIVGIALGGMRFGISAREIGEQKIDTLQRLRFIAEQISTKLKSFHPLFIQPTPVPSTTAIKTETDIIDKAKKPIKKFLAFEGLPNSIRFITYADSLSIIGNNHWSHEVQFYLGEHPLTKETGIIMKEQEILFEDSFITPNPESSRYVLLAKDVAYLKFRYYKTRRLKPEELLYQSDPTLLFIDEWVETVLLEFEDPLAPPANNAQSAMLPDEDQLTKISSPRAVEISIGIKEQQLPGKDKDVEPKIIYLPPMLIPLNSGLQIVRPPEEVKNEQT
jgi:prepilin-type N-terminal cleavage/methylation domain-containing protein